MSNDFQVGSRFGNYELEAYLGGGSFGAVWRGREVETGQIVAIKLLTGALSSSETAGTRADVEMLAAGAVGASPHVVHVLGGGLQPVPHIVMEYIEGSDLLSLLNSQQKLTPDKTIDVGLSVFEALRVLNQVGIVHRDIKPANVMIDKDGVVKLADFGIAKIVGYDSMTMTGQAAMTMAYAAPEIWDENGPFGRPSHKSDLYAMGVLLYQCMSGVTPFNGNYGALYRAHTESRPDIASLPAGTPASLRDLISRCLEKRQVDRPADASECVTELRRASTELAELNGGPPANEPTHFGPWTRKAPHPTRPWAWRCLNETTGQEATVEVYFADNLDAGQALHKALDVNPKLTRFGAERLVDTNRLLMHPNESWIDPPAGAFQFWLAREDLPQQAAVRVTLPMLRSSTAALASMIGVAASEGVALHLTAGDLTCRSDGDVYVRRPCLADGTGPDADPNDIAMAFLRGLPLDDEAAAFISKATDFQTLGIQALNLGHADPAAATTMAPTGMATTFAGSATAVLCPSCHQPMRPGDTACANCGYSLVATPPAEATSVAPRQPVAPVVPIAAAAAPAAVASGLTGLSLALEPTTRSRNASDYDLVLRNSSGQIKDLSLNAYDSGAGLAYAIPQHVMVREASSERVHIRVEPRKRRWFGGKRSWHFTVVASGAGGGGGEPPLTVEGEFEDEPPAWPLYLTALSAVGILALLAVVAVLALGGSKSGNAAGGSSGNSLLAESTATSTAVAAPTATTAPAIVQPTESPPPPPPPAADSPEPNRADCNVIRASGTYLSDTERVWFQTNCINAAPAGGGTTSSGSTSSGGGSASSGDGTTTTQPPVVVQPSLPPPAAPTATTAPAIPSIINVGCPSSLARSGDTLTCTPTISGETATTMYVWTAGGQVSTGAPTTSYDRNFTTRLQNHADISLKVCDGPIQLGRCSATVTAHVDVACIKNANGGGC